LFQAGKQFTAVSSCNKCTLYQPVPDHGFLMQGICTSTVYKVQSKGTDNVC